MRIEELILNSTTTVTDDTGTYTMAQIRAMADKVKCKLLNSGIKKNQPVVLPVVNGVEFIAELFGILSAGAVAVPVDASIPVDATPLPGDDPALILFSSGTTGQPKGIVLSHRAIINNMKAIAAYLQPCKDDIFYIAKSMVHSSTITGEILLAIYSGANIIALKPALAFSQTLKRIEAHRPSILCIPPSLLHFIANDKSGASRLQSLRIIHVSGSIINKENFKRTQQLLPHVKLYNGYGLTEVSPRVSQTCGSDTYEFGSIGEPIQGVQVEIRKEDGAICNPGETGELYVQSNAMMEGYWRNGAIDNSMITSGWLATGDIGYMTASGDLVVTGRKDDMIITGAHNVLPNDVEEVIMQSGYVDDCMVFGVDDEVLGQRVVCAYTSSSSKDSQLKAWCSKHLSAYQVPKNFYQWDEIPVNANGKKSRKLVSVVIPVYNQSASLDVVLRFFNHQSYNNFEVIVVDDGSHEPVVPGNYNYKITISRTINRGRAAARNHGISLAKGELIIFCDADRIPGPDFIQSHVLFHAHNKNAAVIGCPWDCFLGEQKLKNIEAANFNQIQKFSRKPAYFNNISTLFTNGKTNSNIAWAAFLVGNSSIQKSDLLKAGGFDENFRNWGFEHFELAIRLLQHHISICLCENAGNYHIPHPRDQQKLKANIRESISLLSNKYPGAKMHLLEDFISGEITLQQFEQQFGNSLKTERSKALNLKFQNI